MNDIYYNSNVELYYDPINTNYILLLLIKYYSNYFRNKYTVCTVIKQYDSIDH